MLVQYCGVVCLLIIPLQADWTEQDIYEDPTGPLVERGVDPVTAFIADGGDRLVDTPW